jgi:hypothetical protein
MNELLKNLYSSKWGKINEMLQSFNEDDPEDLENLATHPLLIKTDDEYAKADLKVMFFGQETNEWNGVFEEYADLESVLAVYEDFYLKRGYEQYGKPFWNFIRNLKSTQSTKKIGYIWNNVLKIGKSESGTPQQGLINYTIDYFNVIPQEIEILKPNVLLFLSGHTYDDHIRKTIGNFSIVPIEGFSTNELCILKFDNISVDLAIRTYHPGYLQRLGERRMNITETIVNLIEKQC